MNIQAIDTLDEIHEQSRGLLAVLMTQIRAVDEGGADTVSDRVMISFLWQLAANMDRAEEATRALTQPKVKP